MTHFKKVLEVKIQQRFTNHILFKNDSGCIYKPSYPAINLHCKFNYAPVFKRIASRPFSM